ncbi:hypothetical protein SARC_17592, partial [Sphaeroforma arctica JP610]
LIHTPKANLIHTWSCTASPCAAHTVESSLKTDEQLFVKGLSATCPRCGTDIADIVQSHATGDEERLGSDAASHLD